MEVWLLSVGGRAHALAARLPGKHAHGRVRMYVRLPGVFGGEEEGGGVRSGPGAARTILLFHIISARPPQQPRMVRTFLKVHARPRLAYPLRW